jgi:hypothetical protein
MTNDSPIWALLIMFAGGSFFLSCGIWILRTPTKRLVEWDRRIGYWIYQSELKRSGDEKRALDLAGGFYKVFGWLYVGFCAFYLLGVTAAFIAFLSGVPFTMVTRDISKSCG